MGVTVSCKKTGHGFDLGSGGFFLLRCKVAELVGEPLASHYKKLWRTPLFEGRKEYFEEYDKETERLIQEKKVSIKIADFLYQTDVEGSIHYGACKQILKVIGDYDDDFLYGYVGRKDCARFRDFKKILQECVDHKCDLIWR